MDARQQLLQQWVNAQVSEHQLGEPQGQLETVSGDASFRRYFRQHTASDSLICVDAPPEKEDSHPFVEIARSWYAQGVPVPQVLAVDFSQGFMLLSDLGNDLLLPALNETTADRLYEQAIDGLIQIQQTHTDHYALPPYDAELLDREMALFPDWYLTKHLGMELSASDRRILDETFELLRDTALGQPQVPVHRDYHSRNLMLVDQQGQSQLGVIDFQDAVMGPFTYDLVSLLKDCYIQWPSEKVEQWAQLYFQKAHDAGIAGGQSPEQLMLWFDWMGLQRHIKVAGIFARLNYRDGKAGYLNDIPLTMTYIEQVAGKYQGLSVFHQWLVEKVLPRQAAYQAAHESAAQNKQDKTQQAKVED